MIYDIITLVIILVFVIIGAVRGAAKTLLGLLATIVSYLGAVFLGQLFSNLIYNAMIKERIIQSVTKSFSEIGGDISDKAIDTLPGFVKSLLSLSGESIDSAIASSSSQAAEAMEQALRPIVIAIMAVVLTVVLVVILSVLIRLLVVKPLTKMFESSPLKGINRFFGGVLGLLEGVLTVCALAYLLKLLIPILHPDSYLFSESTIYNSYIFYHFYSGNIFSAITSIL